MQKQIWYSFDELRAMAKQCGNYATAKYMQKRGYSLESTLYILFKQGAQNAN